MCKFCIVGPKAVVEILQESTTRPAPVENLLVFLGHTSKRTAMSQMRKVESRRMFHSYLNYFQQDEKLVLMQETKLNHNYIKRLNSGSRSIYINIRTVAIVRGEWEMLEMAPLGDFISPVISRMERNGDKKDRHHFYGEIETRRFVLCSVMTCFGIKIYNNTHSKIQDRCFNIMR